MGRKSNANKILEALGIPPEGRRAPGQPEAIVIRHPGESNFGTLLGQQTVAELQDLMNSVAARMQQMAQAYANISPTWVQRDSAGFVDWTNDWNALQVRVNAAQTAAQSAVTAAALNPLPASLIAAQPPYDALLKSIRQCAPPDGCPAVKGDWDDLWTRLTAAATAAGQPAPSIALPQPVATDVDQQVFAASASTDVVAMATGAQQPKGPLGAILTALGGGGGGGSPSGPGLTWALMGVIAGVSGMIGFNAGGPVGGAFGAALGLAGYEIVKLKITNALKL